MVRTIFFSVLAIIAGLFLITLVSEGVEVFVVMISSGRPLSELTQDTADYFAVRNQPAIVILKLIYNTLAAFLGGYACASIARSRPFAHVVGLAAIQTVGFVYGMTLSEFADTTPRWLWLSLTLLSALAILSAGYLRMRRNG